MNMIEALEVGNNVEYRQREVINTYPDILCSYVKQDSGAIPIYARSLDIYSYLELSYFQTITYIIAA